MAHFDLKKSVRERIKLLLEIQSIDSQTVAAEVLGIPRSTLKNILYRDSIGPRTAQKIADNLGVSYKWIRTGEGPMTPKGTEIQGYIGFSSDEVADKIGRIGTAEESGEEFEIKPGELVYVRKAKSKLSAGGGILPEEATLPEPYGFRREYLSSRVTSIRNALLMDVDGDSMYPTLWNGDTVLIDRGRTEVESDAVYAIGIGDVIQIKRLVKLPGGKLRIISDNAAYYDYTVDQHDVRIIGRIRWHGHDWP